MVTQNLDTIVDVTVEVSPLAAARATFDIPLIIGTSAVIPAAERVRSYTAVADMLDDGFTLTSPEYLAASIIMAQSPAPTEVMIGRQDLTASPAETPLAAIEACREADPDWYVAICLAAVTADHKLIALWAQTAVPSTVYAYTTSDADVLAATASPANLGLYLKNLDYNRIIGQYSTTQSAVYPNNIYAICGIIGYAMGKNTGLANSAYTLKFKEETGIAVEPLTRTQVLAIEGNNVNLYLSYGGLYNIFEQGKMANGQFFDEIINLDMLVNDIQLSVMDLLYGTTKVPQTDAGINQLVHVINEACESAVTRGFLAPGIWTGTPVLNLNTDDPLPKGYLVQAQAIADQSSADRELRKSPSIYVCIKEAGAVHSLTLGIYVNR
jgi:hypothetical protein